uniref:Bm398 n=1 Tax=Brugia malayi TaxID=6279 RepID=A0A0I9N8K3_BRUMA|nr:Bm398 [Brugia malayi]
MLQSKLKGLNGLPIFPKSLNTNGFTAKPLYWSFELAQVYSWCVDVSGRGQLHLSSEGTYLSSSSGNYQHSQQHKFREIQV